MKNILNNKNYSTWFSIILNCIILAVFIFILPDYMKNNDAEDYFNEYEPIALNIVNGDEYNFYDTNNCKDIILDAYNDCLVQMYLTQNAQFRRPPIFPALIAVSYKLQNYFNINQITILLYLQYFMFLASSFFIFLTYLNFFQNNKIAFFASSLFSSYPLSLYLLKQPNSEVIFNFLLVFFGFIFTSYLKNNNYLNGFSLYLSGFVFGLLILTRSIAIYLPIFLFIFLLIYYRSHIFKMFSKLLIGLLIVLLPWQIYINTLTINTPQPMQNYDSNIQRDLSSSLITLGLHWEKTPGRNSSGVSKFMSDDLISFMERTNEKSQAGLINLKREVLLHLLDETLESPTLILEIIFWKGMRALYATDSKRLELEIFIINFSYFILLTVLFFKRKYFFRDRESKKFSKFVICIFLYFYLISMATLPIVRYSLSGIIFIIPIISLMFKRD